MISKVWWDQCLITKDMIYKFFRCTGIANALKGSEDYFFTAWKKMSEENPLIKNYIEESHEDSFVDQDFEDKFYVIIIINLKNKN